MDAPRYGPHGRVGHCPRRSRESGRGIGATGACDPHSRGRRPSSATLSRRTCVGGVAMAVPAWDTIVPFPSRVARRNSFP
eukprot:15979823-Heterocapsa_arctica.AAC.1